MPSQVTIAQILRGLERRAPTATAERWDNVGLLVGDPAWKTSGAVVGVDLTAETVKLAKRRGYRLIVNHHPCIFPRSKGVARVVPGEEDSLSTLIFDCIRSGIAVISCHTNFDRCALEVIDLVARGLKVTPKGRLFERSERGEFVKLAVFVPESHLEGVRSAITEAGAGKIGQYDTCTFGVDGIGSFRGGVGTNPFLGAPGKLEKVSETRLETILPRGLESQVLRALRGAHPYEEVAYDLYPVEQAPAETGLVKGLGYGFWGEFEKTLDFSEFADRVRSLFSVKGFLISGSSPRRIRKMAYSAGKGSSFLTHANSLDCDVMITGEAGYHAAIDSARSGMAVVVLGHRESECFFPKVMTRWLSSPEFGLKTVSALAPVQKLMI